MLALGAISLILVNKIDFKFGNHELFFSFTPFTSPLYLVVFCL